MLPPPARRRARDVRTGSRCSSTTRSASRARCSRSCGSGSAGRARSGCCASSRVTPTAGTCRSSRRRSARSGTPCSTSGARRSGATRATIIRTVNVGLAIGADDAARPPPGRAAAEDVRRHDRLGAPGHLIGTPAQVRDRIGEYERAGVAMADPGAPRPVRLGRSRSLHPRGHARVHAGRFPMLIWIDGSLPAARRGGRLRVRPRAPLRRRRVRGHPHLRSPHLPPRRASRPALRRRRGPSRSTSRSTREELTAADRRDGAREPHGRRLHPPRSSRAASAISGVDPPVPASHRDHHRDEHPGVSRRALRATASRSSRRRSARCRTTRFDPRVKSLNYLKNVLAKIDAHARRRAGGDHAERPRASSRSARPTTSSSCAAASCSRRRRRTARSKASRAARSSSSPARPASTARESAAHALRRLHGRRMLPDRHRRRGHARSCTSTAGRSATARPAR